MSQTVLPSLSAFVQITSDGSQNLCITGLIPILAGRVRTTRSSYAFVPQAHEDLFSLIDILHLKLSLFLFHLSICQSVAFYTQDKKLDYMAHHDNKVL